ncbi:MAG: hypothetical protein E6Q44_15600 [Flavobacteriales bacterium]|nr:MAG: hypothetical protein E6Q44_15600 [Flavobacteriales bacterium]
MHRPLLLALFGCTLLAASLPSCKKDAEDTASPTAPSAPSARSTLALAHHVDGAPLEYDTLRYANEAGHGYSVTRLEYYLSALTLIGSNGTSDHVIAGPWYIHGANGSSIDLGVLPAGTYAGATVLLGLPPDLNQTGALPNTMENLNMAWPDMMGGGYHFLKFEGHFIHNGQPNGFAMHLGRDANLPTCAMAQPFTLDGTADTLTLRFNLNEVFRTPHTYDLPSGNMSMGSMALMGLLRDNCADAFTLVHTP